MNGQPLQCHYCNMAVHNFTIKKTPSHFLTHYCKVCTQVLCPFNFAKITTMIFVPISIPPSLKWEKCRNISDSDTSPSINSHFVASLKLNSITDMGISTLSISMNTQHIYSIDVAINSPLCLLHHKLIGLLLC